jgi:ubiquinol-cytochrome c reductase subunit 7
MKESNDVIAEAVRRLPKEVFDERQFRLSRAIQYNSGKTILPESQWTKPEDVRTFDFLF